MKNIIQFLMLGVFGLIALPLFSQNVYLELNLNNQAFQNRLYSLRHKSDLEIFRVIEKAGDDNRIKGIVLNISAFSAGTETMWELRGALEQFKSKGKKICAFISGADLDRYYLASVADKIVMDEQGALQLTGYAWGRGFVQHSLEKLGIGVRELRYLDYKSANEMFTRDSLSEADRRQYGAYLDDIFTVTRNAVMQGRSLTQERFDEILNRGFLYSAKNALAEGLVDRIGRDEAVSAMINEMEGAEVDHFTLYGDSLSSLSDSKYYYNAGRGKGPQIAVIYANGQTDMEQGMAARSLAHTIREVSEKKTRQGNCAADQFTGGQRRSRRLHQQRGAVCKRADAGGGFHGSGCGIRRLLGRHERKPHHRFAVHLDRFNRRYRRVVLR
jgi:protease-4